ncbi:SEC7 and coiled-coil domain-containing protein 1 [Takifugu flavidus]|uniref:SEC7 and coiled-coil domain-containing protein 1 n=1 Tax=Takifugu flavidus TaxID=433684 RepID=A0A5C6PTM6_9TELE|nr:SEC7 and coiled-coil domain-containing protein 1 [Takifugu flavidus]
MCDLVLVKDRKCVTFVVVRCEKRGNGSVTEHQITGSPDHQITRSRIRSACISAGRLKDEIAENLYDSIKNEPFKIPEDDGNDLTHTFFNPDREGWLLKLGGRVKTWKRRWFILTDNCLYYFEYTTDKEPRGIIPLENLSIREVEDSKKPGEEAPLPQDSPVVLFRYRTALSSSSRPQRPGDKGLQDGGGRPRRRGNHTFYHRISAPTAEEKDEWISSIKAAISRDPFYEMLASRKKKVSSLKAL